MEDQQDTTVNNEEQNAPQKIAVKDHSDLSEGTNAGNAPVVNEPDAGYAPHPVVVETAAQDIVGGTNGDKHGKKHAVWTLSRVLMIVFVVWLMVLAGGAIYLWRDNAANEAEAMLAAQIKDLKASVLSLERRLAIAEGDGQKTCSPVSPGATTVENIKASITSGNTAALEGYMAPSVNVVSAETNGVQAASPASAVSNITSFIAGTGSSWNFALGESELNYFTQGQFQQYFTDISVIGESAGGKVISFSFNCNGKISSVLLAANKQVLQ